MQFLAGQLNITKDQAMAQIAQSNFLKVPATVQDCERGRTRRL